MASLQSYLAIISIFFFIFSSIEANNGAFTINLVRKNSPRNPRSPHIRPFNNIVQAPIHAYLGQYLIDLSIGTPPVKITGIIDTGSDLVWVQCVPCIGCYKQLNPFFDPSKSSSYKNISCDSPLCHKVDTGVCSQNRNCNYSYGYGDNSLTLGVLAQETFTLPSESGKLTLLNNIVFGCGHNDTGNFNDHEMGLIGLGRGPASLISQLAPFVGGKVFSQCLVLFGTDVSISSKMTFGKVSSDKNDHSIVSTPMVPPTGGDQTPYLVTLLGISVDNTYLPFSTSGSNVKKGNMMIDSGTPPTILPTQLYARVVDEVRKKVVSMQPITDDPTLGIQLCYHTKTNLNEPTLTYHFEGAANLTLRSYQVFIPPDTTHKDVFCLALTNTTDNNIGIYGNFAQSNHLIQFDMDKQVVSFKPTDCTKH